MKCISFSDEYLKKCNEPKKIETPPQPPTQQARNPVIYDTASLKALLPAAQKHLVCSQAERSSPITQVCQSLSKINLPLERSYKEEEEMKVKAAWPSTSTEAAAVVEAAVVRRRKKSEDCTNLNLINNNGSSSASPSEAVADMSLKRRSYHPQDYLSKVLQPNIRPTGPPKRRDFPKVTTLLTCFS